MRQYKSTVSHLLAALLGVCLLMMPMAASADGASVITPERNQELKDQLQADIDDILNMETPIVHADEYIPGETYTGRAFYFSSSEGDDQNDGRSPETPKKNYDQFYDMYPGDAVFFKRGDVFRIGVNEYGMNNLSLFTDEVTYSAYGEGPKPVFTSSPMNGASPSLWTLYDEDETGMKIWQFNEPLGDIATVVLGSENPIAAQRVYEYFVTDGYRPCEAHGFQMEEGGYITLGEKTLSPAEQLTEDLTFLSRPEVNVYDGYTAPEGEGPLYLRCDAGNPGEVYDSIEFALRNLGATFWVQSDSVVIDNLSFRYNGISDIKNDGNMKRGRRLIVQNCEFAYCGGSVERYRVRADGTGMGMVQGDGIYGFYVDITVRHNYFHDTCATTATYEYEINTTDRFHGFYRVLDNVIVNTIGLHFDTTSEALQYKDELTIAGNQIWHTGETDRGTDKGSYYYAEGAISQPPHHYGSCVIRDNVFYCTTNNHPMNALLNFCVDNVHELFKFSDNVLINNIYVQHEGGKFAYFFYYNGEDWMIDDPDLKDKAASRMGDTTSEFYILPDSMAE